MKSSFLSSPGRFILFSPFLLLLASCAFVPVQTENLLRSDRSIPETSRVADVPFVAQTENYCGPAALTMAMKWSGAEIGLEELGKQMYTPGKKGTLQADVLSASRRNGMLAITVKGIPDLLKEIAAGHPVIVLQNLAIQWFPQWHYAVAHGYDLKSVELTLHSGPTANESQGLREFERTWSLADYWGVVVLPPTKLSATGTELQHAEAAAALEQIGKLREAEQVYSNMLGRWPESLSALIGLGNTNYAAQDFKRAVRFLREAAKVYPQSAVVWHNLATAEGAAGQRARAKASAQKAMSLALSEAEKEAYRQSLQEWLKI